MAEMRQPGDQSTTAVLWHPFRNELVTCNALGHVQVSLAASEVEVLGSGSGVQVSGSVMQRRWAMCRSAWLGGFGVQGPRAEDRSWAQGSGHGSCCVQDIAAKC